MQASRKTQGVGGFSGKVELSPSDCSVPRGIKIRGNELPKSSHPRSSSYEDRRTVSATRSSGRNSGNKLSFSAITAQEEERKRIARDLHDEAGQILTALRINLETLALAAIQEYSKVALEHSLDLCRQAEESVDRVIYDLRPPLLDDFGVVEAIDYHVRSRLVPIGIAVAVKVKGEERRLLPAQEVAVFRVSQESITNIIRHARARHVSVQLEFKLNEFVLRIDDDGLGLDAIQLADQARPKQGLGLLGMKERMKSVGGTMRIKSRRGTGTRVEAYLRCDKDELCDDD